MNNALDRAVARCKKHEGLRLKKYKCSADREGVDRWTIGYGYLIPKGEESRYENGITLEVAEQLFARAWSAAVSMASLICAENDSRHLQEDPVRFGVLVEMCYQHGGHAIATGWPQFLAACARKDWPRAWREMRYRNGHPDVPEPADSLWRTQTRSRCDLLSDILQQGVDLEPPED